jgi:branched-chain amino acid transport system substrate-binding protein
MANVRRGLLTLLLLVAFPIAGFANIKIALTGPFSGGSAPMGTSMRDGAKLAIDAINVRGGIKLGGGMQKIEVIERDDEGKNDRGTQVAEELAAMPDLAGVIGTVNTGIAMAGDKYFKDKGIPKIITPAAGSASMLQWSRAQVPELSIFRFAAHDGIQSEMVVDEAIRLQFKKVSILYDDTNYGVSGRDDLLAKIKGRGGKLSVVTVESFAIGDKDMTRQLVKAKAGGAQAVLIWGIGPELAAVAGGMQKIGLKVPLIGGWTLSMSNFIDTAGAAGDGALMPQTFIEDPTIPQAKGFIAAYHTKYKVGRIPSPVSAAQGYDAVLIFVAALEQAGSTDHAKVVAALEDLKTPVRGVIATWKKPFSKWNPTEEETHEAFRRQHVVMGKVQSGRVVFADPNDRKRLAEEK